MNYDELAREEAVIMLNAVSEELTNREQSVGLSAEDDPVITLIEWVEAYLSGFRPEFDECVAEILDRREGLVQERYRASVLKCLAEEEATGMGSENL